MPGQARAAKGSGPAHRRGWQHAGAAVAGERASQLSELRKQKVHSACPSVSRCCCLQTALPKVPES